MDGRLASIASQHIEPMRKKTVLEIERTMVLLHWMRTWRNVVNILGQFHLWHRQLWQQKNPRLFKHWFCVLCIRKTDSVNIYKLKWRMRNWNLWLVEVALSINCQPYDDHVAANCPREDTPMCFRSDQNHPFNPNCRTMSAVHTTKAIIRVTVPTAKSKSTNEESVSSLPNPSIVFNDNNRLLLHPLRTTTPPIQRHQRPYSIVQRY